MICILILKSKYFQVLIAKYYTIDKYDHSKYGILQLDDSILTIHATVAISVDEFLELFSK